ncbi:hypothetical protein [Arthrobacter sp. B1805]|uniref:hypothetical protein n=1 Tax=Arthrobacter sp. B1805 TaxID=2058892 RepID=UPI000CE563AB|nr:hypothetical protein [Arthrobacter sp. B1805]
MAETGDLTIPLPTRLNMAAQLVVITRFVAALCWLGVLATLGIITDGALLLLSFPLIITALATWAARYSRKQVHGTRGSEAASESVLGRTAVVPVYYAAALSWIVIAAAIFHGNIGLVSLTALPLLATFAAYGANKRLKRELAENSTQMM